MLPLKTAQEDKEEDEESTKETSMDVAAILNGPFLSEEEQKNGIKGFS